jgi:hypothetical protein
LPALALQVPPTTTLESALQRIAQRLARNVSDGMRPVCDMPGNAGRIDAVERWTFEQPQRLAGVDVLQVLALALGPAGGTRRWAAPA